MGRWEMFALTDVSDFQGGTQPPKDEWLTEPADGYIRMLQIRDFTQERAGKEEYVKQTEKLKTCDKDDILIGRYGASVGKILTGLSGAYNVAIVKTMPNDDLLYRPFFKYYLQSPYFQNFILNVGSRAAQAGFNKDDLARAEINLPDLPVQQQIADVLDRASALIKKRKAQIDKLDLLIKSQFIKMFGDPVTNPNRWEIGTIRDLVTDVKYGTSKPAETEGKYVYLRMNNITYNGSIDLANLKHINVDKKEYEKYVVRKGDLLFNRTNSKELVGKTAVFKEDTPMIIAGYIIRVRTNEKANSEYISAFLNSRFGKGLLYDMCKAIVGQANINAQELQNIKIPITPINLQNQFANFVQQFEAQKSLFQQSIIKLELTYRSLMQKCFRGEIF